MSYKALYRTYRPSTFNEVAGQKAIVRTLQNALLQNKIAHAYLFSGPRGTGKTSMAKLFAKALNCEEGVGKQCNVCLNCQGINDGSHPDVYEIDAASNNGVDDVRQLIENINYAPIRGRHKVYIIDEVHMMTQSAFNALLKTLEEPPKNVIFILATTEAHKVIPTILSRCQRYNFAKVGDKDIKSRLITVLKRESVTYEDGALDVLVSLADGGVRDALSMLDQVLAYANQKVRLDDVLALFALTSKLEQINLIHALATFDVEKVFSLVNELLEKGVDIRRLTSDLLNLLKDLLIYNRTQSEDLLIYLRKEEAVTLLKNLVPTHVNFMIEQLLKAQTDFRFASDIKNIFEITLLRIMSSVNKEEPQPKQEKEVIPTYVPKANKPAPKEVKAPEPVLEEELPPFLSAPPPIVNTTREAVKAEVERPLVGKEKPKKSVKRPDSKNALKREGTIIKLSDDILIKILTLADRDEKMSLKNDRWDQLELLTMDADRGDYAALLFDGTPYALSSEILIMEFPFERSASLTNIKENQDFIQDIIGELIGRRIPVYALSTGEAVALTKKYRNLSQIKKLPKVNSVASELEGKY